MSLTVFVLFNVDEDDDDFTLNFMNMSHARAYRNSVLLITPISIYINCNDRDEFCLLNERKNAFAKRKKGKRRTNEQKTQLNPLTNVSRALKCTTNSTKSTANKMNWENIAIVWRLDEIINL